MKHSKPRRAANADWWHKQDLAVQQRVVNRKAREIRSITDQMEELDERLGLDTGACRERNRLRMSIPEYPE